MTDRPVVTRVLLLTFCENLDNAFQMDFFFKGSHVLSRGEKIHIALPSQTNKEGQRPSKCFSQKGKEEIIWLRYFLEVDFDLFV